MATIINININGYGVTQTTEPSPDPYRTYTLLPGFSPVRELFGERKIKAKKKKKCDKGQVCGFGCISKTKTCTANMTAAEFKAHNAAKRAAKKAAKGGGSGGGDSGASQPQQGFPGENNGVKHKPFMSEAEANEYVKGSVWADQNFFHGTSEQGAESITTDGVNIDANVVAAHGKGFYMGGGESGYDIADGFSSGAVLSMKVLANNPLIVDGKGHSEIVARGLSEGKISVDVYDAKKKITAEMQAQHQDEVTNYIKSLGHDAIYLSDRSHFIVFDPKQVAVFKRENTDIDLDDLII